MVYCKICQKELHQKAEICPDCGVRNAQSTEKIPELSIILSLIIPGLGQSYNGQKIKAAAFFNAGMIIFLTTVVYKIEFISMINKTLLLSVLSEIEFMSIFNKENLILLVVNHIEWVYPIFVMANVFDAYRIALKINSEI